MCGKSMFTKLATPSMSARSRGRFSVGGLPPAPDGTYTVEVSPPFDHRELLRASVPAPSTQDRSKWPVTVETVPGSGRVSFGVATNTITVKVQRPNGDPVTSGAFVNAFDHPQINSLCNTAA